MQNLDLGRGKVQLVPDDGTPWDVAVTLRSEGSESTGQLSALGPDGATTTRELSGTSCEAVAAGLLIATALAIDPERVSEERSRPEPERTTPPRVVLAPARGEPSAEDSGVERSGVRRRPASWQWGFGAAGGIAFGPTQEIGQQAALFLDATANRRTSVRLYGLRAFPRTEEHDWGTAHVSASLVGLELCPTRLWPTTGFALVPCAFATLGVLEATGSITESGGKSSDGRYPWADVGLASRAEWVVSSMWQFEIRGTVATPLTRYRYTLTGPETVIGEVPLLAAGGSVGLMLRFP